MEWAQIAYHNIKNKICRKLTWEFAISNLVLTAIAIQETTHPKMKIQLIDISPLCCWKDKFYFGREIPAAL